MVLSNILEQIVDWDEDRVNILISKNYITFYYEIEEIWHVISLFNFDGNPINSYTHNSHYSGPNKLLTYNIITACIVPNVHRDCFKFVWLHLPDCILSGRETHLIALTQLENKVHRDIFEQLCEQNRISGPLMRYWEFDCRIVYSQSS